MGMKVLLIGSGGREHALAWKLAQSPLLTRSTPPPAIPASPNARRSFPLDIDDHAPSRPSARKTA
jgi:phosphoribosylamine--glycine ligase